MKNPDEKGYESYSRRWKELTELQGSKDDSLLLRTKSPYFAVLYTRIRNFKRIIMALFEKIPIGNLIFPIRICES